MMPQLRDCSDIEKLIAETNNRIARRQLEDSINGWHLFIKYAQQKIDRIERAIRKERGLTETLRRLSAPGPDALDQLYEQLKAAHAYLKELERRVARDLDDLSQLPSYPTSDIDFIHNTNDAAGRPMLLGVDPIEDLRRLRKHLEDDLEQCRVDNGEACLPRSGACWQSPGCSELYEQAKHLRDLYEEIQELQAINRLSGLGLNVEMLGDELARIEEEWRALRGDCCHECGADIGPTPAAPALENAPGRLQ